MPRSVRHAAPSLRSASGGHAPRSSPAMALETSAAVPRPGPRRSPTRSRSWIDRLGAVWVEGQVAQISRRPGLSTVFLTLRDPVADISVPVTVLAHPRSTASTRRWSRAPASWCTPSRPSTPTAARSRCAAREIRMVGLGELLARLERRRQLLAAEGLFAARAEAAAAVPARAASGWSPRRARPPSATCSTTPGAAGRRSRFEVAYAAMQGPRAARRGDRGGRAARPRPATST